MSHPAIAILRTLMHVPLLHLPFTTHRYSPTPFSRTTPLDASSTWLPKNPFYESWVHKRNMLHEQFSWNFRNTVEVSYYLVGLSVGAFAFGTWTLNSVDAMNGYPKRDLVFSGWVLGPFSRE
eukprot:scaffold89275_cov17-Tisochrysis_lutea.AAC.1